MIWATLGMVWATFGQHFVSSKRRPVDTLREALLALLQQFQTNAIALQTRSQLAPFLRSLSTCSAIYSIIMISLRWS